MKFSFIYIFNTIVALGYSFLLLFFPSQLLTIHGISPDPSALLMGRYFGVALLGMGLATWLARNSVASEARDAITLGFFISYIPGVIISLYGVLSGQMNALGWLAAANGDPSGMAVSTLIGPLLSARSSIWGHNASLRASLGQFDPKWDYSAELNPPDSIMGSPASTLAYAGYSGWPASFIPEEYRQVQPSDVETLLVSGSIDFDTPMQFARDELLPSLRNGQHVIVSEYGHGEFLALQPEASERLLTGFYATGLVDDSLFTNQPVNFQVGIGYPAMAKLGLAAIVLVLVIVVAVIWFILRRVRRNRSSVNPN